jgi:AcrR family transcriptional regulator
VTLTPPKVQVAGSLRERKKWATRAALRRAAVRLAARRGIAAVTVEEIAEAADVCARTFFNYFETKEDALSGWDPVVTTEMVERLRHRPPGESAPVALRSVLLDVLPQFADDHRDLLERLQVVRSDPHLVAHGASRWADTEAQLVDVLTERIGADAARHQFVALVVATSIAASRVAMMSWCDQGGKVPLEEELALHLDFLAAGIAKPQTLGASRDGAS